MVNNLKGPVFRYGISTTIITAIALAYSWPASYLLPVLSLGFFAPGKTMPGLKEGIGFVTIIAVSLLTGIVLGGLIDKPVVLLLLMFLLLFHVYYSMHPLMNMNTKLWMIISIMLMPMMELVYPSLAIGVASNLLIGAAGAIILTWLMFGLFPDKEKDLSEQQEQNKPKPEIPTRIERMQKALLSTSVVFPIILFVYFTKWTDGLLPMIFIAIFSMQPKVAFGSKMGKALIVGNVMGGLISILIYYLLIIVPNFYFFVLVMLFTSLVMGNAFYSGGKFAPLFNTALSTTILILGSVTADSAIDTGAGAKAWSRVFQLSLAVIYVVTVLGMVEKWKSYSLAVYEKPE